MSSPRVKITTHLERFTEAVALLCGQRPPEDLVRAWINREDVPCKLTLQDWAADNTPLRWAQGIVVLDAAMLLADTPEEGYGHLCQDGRAYE